MSTFNTTTSNYGGIPLAFDFDRPIEYVIYIYHILFGTTAALVAGTVTVGISTTKNLRAQNRFLFMLNTSVSDTMTGLSVFYLCLFDVQETYPRRNSTYYILPSLLGVNLMTFLFAQFDRYVAVCKPFIYSRFITRRLVIGVNTYCWIQTYFTLLLFNVLPPANALEMHSVNVIILQIVVITKVIMTIKLYIVARYQLDREPPSVERVAKKESLKITILVVITFLVLWLPSMINIMLFGGGLRSPNVSSNGLFLLARINSLSTPVIYLWGSPALREAARRTVWGRLCPILQNRYDKIVT